MSSETTKEKKWYNKIWFTRNFAWLILALISCYYDIKNFFVFRKEIKNLAKDKRSAFNKYGLKVNWLGNIVYTQKIMDKDRVLYLDDRQKNLYLIDNTNLEHEYLFTELNWGEYLITNFIEFADEDDNLSGYYGIEFRFTPISLGNSRIIKYLIFYIVFFGIIIWLCRNWIALGFMFLINLFK